MGGGGGRGKWEGEEGGGGGVPYKPFKLAPTPFSSYTVYISHHTLSPFHRTLYTYHTPSLPPYTIHIPHSLPPTVHYTHTLPSYTIHIPICYHSTSECPWLVVPMPRLWNTHSSPKRNGSHTVRDTTQHGHDPLQLLNDHIRQSP